MAACLLGPLRSFLCKAPGLESLSWHGLCAINRPLQAKPFSIPTINFRSKPASALRSFAFKNVRNEVSLAMSARKAASARALPALVNATSTLRPSRDDFSRQINPAFSSQWVIRNAAKLQLLRFPHDPDTNKIESPAQLIRP